MKKEAKKKSNSSFVGESLQTTSRNEVVMDDCCGTPHIIRQPLGRIEEHSLFTLKYYKKFRSKCLNCGKLGPVKTERCL